MPKSMDSLIGEATLPIKITGVMLIVRHLGEHVGECLSTFTLKNKKKPNWWEVLLYLFIDWVVEVVYGDVRQL